MGIEMKKVKKLRDQTGAGIVDVKNALEEAQGDEAHALDILKKRGHAKAIKKSDRDAREGVIGQYIHSNGKLGVLVKVLCETDFVAKNEEFIALSRDIAMHIAAMNPCCVRPEDVSEAVLEKERMIWKEQDACKGKEEKMVEKILLGKEKKFREEQALLTQAFVKNLEIKVEDLLHEKIAKIGENIQIGDFIRYEM
jgi:elongation factor Ts